MRAKPAFAQGTAEIQVTDPSVRVAFTAATTDDPPGTADAGQLQDVASCSAEVEKGGAVSLSIVNGYPGYACTVEATLANQGVEGAQFQGTTYDVPPALSIAGPPGEPGWVLEPGGQMAQTFEIAVGPGAEQNARYTFHIREVFASATGE